MAIYQVKIMQEQNSDEPLFYGTRINSDAITAHDKSLGDIEKVLWAVMIWPKLGQMGLPVISRWVDFHPKEAGLTKMARLDAPDLSFSFSQDKSRAKAILFQDKTESHHDVSSAFSLISQGLYEQTVCINSSRIDQIFGEDRAHLLVLSLRDEASYSLASPFLMSYLDTALHPINGLDSKAYLKSSFVLASFIKTQKDHFKCTLPLGHARLISDTHKLLINAKYLSPFQSPFGGRVSCTKRLQKELVGVDARITSVSQEMVRFLMDKSIASLDIAMLWLLHGEDITTYKEGLSSHDIMCAAKICADARLIIKPLLDIKISQDNSISQAS